MQEIQFKFLKQSFKRMYILICNHYNIVLIVLEYSLICIAI